jgi:four helix bundle protein
MKIKSYRDLIAWQRSMDLVESVYRETRAFPKEEIYGLTSQLRRAVISIPSNIAEGQGRDSTLEFRRHLFIAHGSLCEAETQIIIAKKLGYLNQTRCEKLLEAGAEIGRIIHGLRNSLKD